MKVGRTELIWQPSAEYVEGSSLEAVMGRIGASGYDELYRLSIDEPARFWGATLAFKHCGYNQRDELVCECTRTGLMLKRPAQQDDVSAAGPEAAQTSQ